MDGGKERGRLPVGENEVEAAFVVPPLVVVDREENVCFFLTFAATGIVAP
jgi:hypothetical protein